jgi:hypothetical protein
MSTNCYITRLVNLESIDHQTFLKNAATKGFGVSVFPASLHSFLNQWTMKRVVLCSHLSKKKQLLPNLTIGILKTVYWEDEFL